MRPVSSSKNPERKNPEAKKIQNSRLPRILLDSLYIQPGPKNEILDSGFFRSTFFRGVIIFSSTSTNINPRYYVVFLEVLVTETRVTYSSLNAMMNGDSVQ